MNYAVILAGGSGTRLWPKSRQNKPKQFLKLFSRRSLLQETARRLKPLVPTQRVLVVAGQGKVREIKKQLPQIPTENILIEPESKNTAPAIGLSALYLNQKDKKAVAAFLPSDHFMAKATEFRRVLKKAFALAQKNQNTVLLGLRPTYPETGYGYIKIKSKSRVTLGQDYPVSQFVEKPNLKTAEKYVLSGNYFWNAGIFIWEIKTLLGLFQKHQPEIYQGLLEIQKNPQNLRLTFQNFPNISIDYALAERAKNIRVIPADLGWSDIGHFGALQAISPNDPNSNVVRGRHLGLDTKNSLIHGLNRLIVTIGLENMIVVDEKDALLICPVNRAQDVKKIVEQLKKEGRQEYL